MKLIICVLSITLAGILLLSTVSSNGQEVQEKEVWKGMLEDGTEISVDDLFEILEEHKKWLETEEKKGQHADLSNANLSKADLSEAILDGANLSGADLYRANLSKAELYRANLSKAYLDGANLSKAYLDGANLSEAILDEANLSGAILDGANLSKANLGGANLSKATVYRANLSEANLPRANLSEAILDGANLSGADLYRANLSKADLGGVNLTNSKFINTNLKDAIISGVDLARSQYEPNSPPHKGSLGGIEGLKTVWFKKGKQSGLVQLRAVLKESGLRDLEREATYAIERRKAHYEPWYKNWVKHLLFEWTCGYGLNYLQPLLILLGMIFVFSVPYMISIKKYKKDGIWKVWTHDRARIDLGREKPERLTLRGYKIFLYGLYFSILSAFHIGWRDLNVGSWISRIQPREYTLKATGWVRVVSGVQSLISIYLLALWVLSQFGRPFD